MAKYSLHLAAPVPDGLYLMNFDDPRSLSDLGKAALQDGFIEINGRREIKLGKTSASATGHCIVFSSQIVTLAAI